MSATDDILIKAVADGEDVNERKKELVVSVHMRAITHTSAHEVPDHHRDSVVFS